MPARPGPGAGLDTPLQPDENAEGIAITMSKEPNRFEPEEDPDACAPDLGSSQD